MKKILPLLLIICIIDFTNAQVKAGDNPNLIDDASLLELESTDKVLVVTRISNEAMIAITPLNGALVYNTDAKCLFQFRNNRWASLCVDVMADETNTTVVDNNDGTYTYTNEFGNQQLIDTRASSNPYNNSNSGITATNVQDAIDELSNRTGTINSTELRITNGVDAVLKDITLAITNDAIDKDKINPDVAGTGLTQATDGSLEVDVTAITGDGTISSPNSSVILTGTPANAALENVGFDVNVDDTTLEVDPTNGVQIKDLGVTTAKIAADAIDNTKVADDAVQTENILDGTIATADIADNAVSTAKVVDDAIDKDKINPDVAGTGLTQATDGSLEVDVTAITGDGTISSPNSSVILTGTPTNAALENVGLDVNVDDTTLEVDPTNGVQIKDLGVTTAKIAADAIDNTKITDDAVQTENILDGTIVTADIADNAVSTAKVVDDAIDKDKINPDIAGTGLTQATDGSLEVDVTAIAGDGTISSPNSSVILTGTPANAALEDVGFDVNVDDTTLETDPTNGVQIKDLGVTTAKIAADAIDNTKIADDAVQTENILDGTIVTADIADNAVSTAKVVDDAIDKDKINPDVAGTGLTQATDGSLEVDVTAIAGDGTISSPNSSVLLTGTPANATLENVGFDVNVDDATLEVDPTNGVQIKDLGVTTAKIAADAIDNTKIADDAVQTENILDGTIVTADIADDAISTAKVVDDAIDKDKINPDVAGTGLTQATDGSLEVDVTAIAGDGTISSPNSSVILTGTPANAALEDVGFDVNVDDTTLETDPTNGVQIKDLGVTTAKIAADAIDNTKITDDAVQTENILDGTIVTADIADNAVSTAKVVDDAIDKDKINPDVAGTGLTQATDGSLEVDVTAITGDGTISSPNSSVILTGTPANAILENVGFDVNVDDTTLEVDPTNGVQIKDLGVTTVKIAADAIDNTKIADDAVQTENILDGTIVTADIANDAIDKDKINPDVAGTGLTQATDGSLEVDVKAIAGDGTISSPNSSVILTGTPANAILENVGFDVNVDDTTLEVDPTNGVQIKDLGVTTVKIAADAIDNTKIADDAVQTENILDGTIVTADIANDAIDKDKINPDVAGTGLTQATDGSLEVDVTAIAGDGTISSPNSSVILTGTPANATLENVGFDVNVDDATLEVDPTNGVQIKDLGVATAKIAADAIDNTKVADDAVQTENILDGTIATVDIASDAIDNIKIADDAVQTENILDGTIATADIADNTVSTAKVVDDAIDKDKINPDVAGTGLTQATDGSLEVDVTAIAGDGTISSPNSSVILTGTPANAILENVGFDVNVDDTTLEVDPTNGVQIKDLGVTTVKIAADAIDNTKVADDAVQTENILDGTIVTADIADNAVSTAKVVDDAIDKEKINPDVAGTGLTQATDGSLEVDVTAITGDGTISSPNSSVILTGTPTNAALENVGFDVNVDDTTLEVDPTNGVQIKDLGVTTAKIAADAIDNTKVADNAVQTENILDGTIATADIASDAIDKDKINPDVAGTGLTQATDGSLEVDVTAITGDGTISSPNSSVILTGTPTNAALENVGFDVNVDDATLEVDPTNGVQIKDLGVTSAKIAADAIDKDKINPDVAGTGLTQATDGSLEVDVTAIAGDGTISSPNSSVILTGTPTNAALENVGFDVNVDDTTLEVDPTNGVQIKDLGVTTAKIAVDAIDNTKVADNAVQTENILDGTIATADIASDAIDKDKINPDVAGTGLTQATDGSLEVDVTAITGDGTISSPNSSVILTGTPTNAALENVGFDVNVDDATLEVDPTNGVQIKNLGVTTAKIATDAIDNTKVADNAVQTENILDGTIATADIANDAIDKDKINPDVAGTGLTQATDGSLEVDVTAIAGDGTISSPNSSVILTGTPTNAALEDVGFDVNVDDATLEVDPTNGVQLKDLGVTTAKIAADAIDNTKITDDAVQTENILDGTIATADIADNAVSTAKVVDDAIDKDKINPDIAGTGLTQATDGSLEVDVTAIAGDGTISSPNSSVLLTGTPTNAALENVGFDVNVDDTTLEIDPTNGVQIKDLGVTTAKIAADAIDNTKVADNAVQTENILDGTILTADISDDAIDKDKINPDVAGTGLTQATDGSLEVDVTAIAGDGTISSPNSSVLLTGTPTNAALENVGFDVNVDDTTLEVDPTNGVQIKDLGVATAKIAADAIDNTKIADDAVQTENILDGTILTADISDDAIDKDKINPDVAGTGLTQATDGSLEVDVTAIAGDGTISSPNSSVILTGTPTNAALENVGFDVNVDDTTLEVDPTNGVQIKDLGVTTAKIAADAIDNTKITDDAVQTENILDGTIVTVDIANDAIDKDKINPDIAGTGLTQATDGSLEVDVTAIAGDGTISSPNSSVILTGTPTNAALENVGFDVNVDDATLEVDPTNGVQIKDLGVTTAKIADDAVQTENILDGTIATVDIASDAIDNTKIADDAVQTENILDGTIITADIANDAIDNTKVADNAVQTENILDGTILTADISDDAIDKDKINPDVAGTGLTQATDGSLEVDVTAIAGDGTISSPNSSVILTGTPANAALENVGFDVNVDDTTLEVDSTNGVQIKDLGVATAKIAADAIDNTKVADDAVQTENILDGTIATADIANDAIDKEKINPDVAGTGLTQATDGSLEVDVTAIAGDGTISSPNSSVLLTGTPTNAILENVGFDVNVDDATLEVDPTNGVQIKDLGVATAKIAADAIDNTKIADDAVQTENILDGTIATADITNDAIDKDKINPDIAGTGLTQATDGSLEVDVTAIAGDGTISSPNSSVILTGTPANAALEDVGFDVNVDDTTLEVDPTNGVQIKDLGVVTAKIAADAIDNTKIADDAVQTENILDGTIVTADIANDAINNTKVADNAVQTENILDGTILTADISDDAIDKDKINPDVAGTGLTQATDGSLEVDVTGIAGDGTISSPNSSVLLTGTPTNAALENVGFDVNVDDATLEVDPTNGVQIKDLGVTTAKIAADAIDNTKIADDAVQTENILDGTIVTADIANDAVSTAKVVDDAIDKDKINPDVAGTGLTQATDGSLEVDVTAIAGDGTISSPNSSVLLTGTPANATLENVGFDVNVDDATLEVDPTNGVQIKDLGVTTAKIAADAIDNTKIADDAVQTENILDGTIVTADIADDVISTAKVVDDAIDKDKINPDVAGTGLTQATDGSLEVDVTAIAGDGTISSPNSSVLLTGTPTNAALEDVGFDVNVDDATLEVDSTNGVQIKDLGVTTAKIAADAIDNTKIADDAIIGGPGGVIRDNSITASDLAPNSVDSSEITSDSVGTSELKDDAVTTDEILNATILTEDIASGGTDKILTTDATGVVTWSDKAANEITTITGLITTGNTIGTYTNEANNPFVIQETITVITDTNAATTKKEIATYLDEDGGTPTSIYETVSDLNEDLNVAGTNNATTSTAKRVLEYEDENGNKEEYTTSITGQSFNETTDVLTLTEGVVNTELSLEHLGDTWKRQGTTESADPDDSSIYKNGTVGIGDFSGNTIDADLHIIGSGALVRVGETSGTKIDLITTGNNTSIEATSAAGTGNTTITTDGGDYVIKGAPTTQSGQLQMKPYQNENTNFIDNKDPQAGLAVETNGDVILVPVIYATGKVAGNGNSNTLYNSEVVKGTTGNYRINFSTALPNANYIIQLTMLDCGGNCPPAGGTNYDDPGITYFGQDANGFNVNIGDNDNGGNPRIDIDQEFMFTVIRLPGIGF